MRKLLIFLMLFCFILVSSVSCDSKNSQNIPKTSVKQIPEKLVVYISGPAHGFQSKDDVMGENIQYYYPSKHIVGMSLIGGELEAVGGNIFHQALVDYSEKTGIQIEVRYMEEYIGEKDVFSTLYKQEGLPDLALFTKHSQYDFYSLAEKGLFLDFSKYAQTDIYNEEVYYQNVMEGGSVEGEQNYLPILFNLNAMITTESYLDEISNTFIGEESITYTEVISLLEQSCIEMASKQNKEAVFEASGLMIAGTYIPSILSSAAYSSYFGKSNEDILISQECISRILELMLLYNQQEFCAADPDWAEKTYEDNKRNSDILSRRLNTLYANFHEYVGVYLSGGRSGGGNFHNNILTDITYFESVYQGQEEVVLCGIPTIDNQNEYSANISVFAAGFSNTKYPEQVFDLAKFLMDYEYPAAYGFSINKYNTDKQLQKAGNSTTILYSDAIWSSVTGGYKTKEEIESETNY